MNTFGVIIGILTLFIIGLGFIWVIYGERYFSYRWWPYVIILGVIIIGISLFIRNDFVSAVVGVFGASFVWGATELKAQAVRSGIGVVQVSWQENPSSIGKFDQKNAQPKDLKSILQFVIITSLMI
jgi:hypothetical protein